MFLINQSNQIQTHFCLINKNNELETLGGWLFLKWITNYDNSLYLSTDTNYLPISMIFFLKKGEKRMIYHFLPK